MILLRPHRLRLQPRLLHLLCLHLQCRHHRRPLPLHIRHSRVVSALERLLTQEGLVAYRNTTLDVLMILNHVLLYDRIPSATATTLANMPRPQLSSYLLVAL